MFVMDKKNERADAFVEESKMSVLDSCSKHNLETKKFINTPTMSTDDQFCPIENEVDIEYIEMDTLGPTIRSSATDVTNICLDFVYL